MILSVLGATGYVGNRLIATLAKTAPDIGIRAFGRNVTKLRRLEGTANIERIETYAYGEEFGLKLAGTDACIDLTYSIQGVPSEVMANARNHGTRLIRAAHDSGLKRVVVTGTIGAYGEPVIRHPWNDAPDPGVLQPNTIYGKAKTAVEDSASRIARQLGVPAAFVRAGHIFGPGSNMAAGIAGLVLTCAPSVLEAGTAPSNATTADGLIATLNQLALKGFEQPVVCANHIDLTNIAYDDLVAYMARIIGIHPIVGNAAIAEAHEKSHLVGLLRSNKKRILLAQAMVGRYDFGLSARIVRRLKHRVGGEDTSGAAADRNGAALVPLYRSQAVPHSTEICGTPIAGNDLTAMLDPIGRWLTRTGYTAGGMAA